MNTAELIARLAADPAPTPRGGVVRRLAPPILAGGAVAATILMLWLGLRPLAQASQTGAFWMKATYTLAMAWAGMMLMERLGRPGRRVGASPLIGVIAAAALGLLALIEVVQAGGSQAAALWLGQTWNVCSLRIVVIAAPIFIGAVLAMRGLAPTRLAAAGAAAGLFAGGAGASLYGLYCQETAAPFVLVWYSLGIAACVGVGALCGPRLLRW